MASQDLWGDFDYLTNTIRTHTVDRLKQVLQGMNDECKIHLSKVGKKQDLIDRILGTLDHFKVARMGDKWSKAKAVLVQVRVSGVYSPGLISTTSPTSSSPITQNTYTSSSIKAPTYPTSTASSSISHFNPYAITRKAGPSVSTSTSVKPFVGAPRQAFHFKESPFLRIDEIVSNIVECAESTSSTDRRQQSVVFTLNAEQINKLKTPGSKYQLRLFCTSSTFYSLNPSIRLNAPPCLIEFPPTCEVRVNGVQLQASLKGLKKKPGTAPPPDLPNVRVNSTQNRVEMVYVNSQQPVLAKKFYMAVKLVETTGVDQLVRNLKSNYRKSAEIQRQMKASTLQDDDIVAGPQKMSLKCPLSYSRITIPCRSYKCVHPNCFDATSWFAVNEQTTTWSCPVCEKSLESSDLIIDGYFDEILHQTPEEVEDVIVEADGEWHTTDNKYGTATWRALHPPPVKSEAPVRPKTVAQAKSNSQNTEIFILDSDDEDEHRVKRELSPSFGPSSSISGLQSQHSLGDVIDLTLDTDDEDEPPSPPRITFDTQSNKRKATELSSVSPVDPSNKKGKMMDIEQITSPNRPSPEYAPTSYVSPAPFPRSAHIQHVLPPPPSSLRYPSYSNGEGLPHLNGSSYLNSSAPIRLPPLSPNASYRVNGQSSSSTGNGWGR